MPIDMSCMGIWHKPRNIIRCRDCWHCGHDLLSPSAHAAIDQRLFWEETHGDVSCHQGRRRRENAQVGRLSVFVILVL